MLRCVIFPCRTVDVREIKRVVAKSSLGYNKTPNYEPQEMKYEGKIPWFLLFAGNFPVLLCFLFIFLVLLCHARFRTPTPTPPNLLLGKQRKKDPKTSRFTRFSRFSKSAPQENPQKMNFVNFGRGGLAVAFGGFSFTTFLNFVLACSGAKM